MILLVNGRIVDSSLLFRVIDMRKEFKVSVKGAAADDSMHVYT
jgi:hypothetical protein